MTDRAHRILHEINPSSYTSTEHLIAAVLRETARDFPAFRTAAKPNEWERGYHCVLDTLHDIANEMDAIAKDNLRDFSLGDK